MRTVLNAIVSFGVLAIVQIASYAHAATTVTAPSRLNDLSGGWDDLENFVTLGQCATAPSPVGLYLCSPAQLPSVRRDRLEASAFVSATDSVLKISDTLRKNEISSDEVKSLFSKYNYSELILSSRIDYVAPYWNFGVRPFRLQGQFEAHNPSLPLGSLAYRDDLSAFLAGGYRVHLKSLLISAGVQGTLIRRKETLAEASLVDFASKPASEILRRQEMTGGFVDAGVIAELPGYFSVSALTRDQGKFFSGEDLSARYLFVHRDRQARWLISAAAIPSIWIGQLQAGAELVGFQEGVNKWDEQWLGTLSFYMGPLRLLSGFRKELLRTGVSLSFDRIEVAVGQEWINRLEPGREAQPRFTLAITAGL